MKGPIQSTAVLARVHSSLVGANMHGVLWGGFGTHLSWDTAPPLDVCCLLNSSLVHKGWLYWRPNRCLWLQHKVGGLLLCSVAQLVLPRETSISAASCGEAQSVIISALLCGSLCEDKGAAKSTYGSCCAGRWHRTLAFCCFLCSLDAASHLASSPPVSQVAVAMNPQFVKGKVLVWRLVGINVSCVKRNQGKNKHRYFVPICSLPSSSSEGPCAAEAQQR